MAGAAGERCSHLAEGMRAVSQLGQNRRLLPQVIVGVGEVHVVTHHGDSQLVVKPADKGTEEDVTFFCSASSLKPAWGRTRTSGGRMKPQQPHLQDAFAAFHVLDQAFTGAAANS